MKIVHVFTSRVGFRADTQRTKKSKHKREKKCFHATFCFFGAPCFVEPTRSNELKYIFFYVFKERGRDGE